MRFLWGIRSVLVVTALMLQSCGASWHLKRAIAKDPEILKQTIVKLDTLVVTDSIVATDTLVLNHIDTVETIKDLVRIKVIRSYDTISVEVECPPDTIRVVREVPVDQLVYVSNKTNWLQKLKWQLLVMAMGVVIFMLIRNQK